jgi:hypothetical protein
MRLQAPKVTNHNLNATAVNISILKIDNIEHSVSTVKLTSFTLLFYVLSELSLSAVEFVVGSIKYGDHQMHFCADD